MASHFSSRSVLCVALASLLAVTVSCSISPRYPDEDLNDLPRGATGAVVLSPIGRESVSSSDRSVVVVFDDAGEALGRSEGGPVSGNRVLASDGRLVAVSAGSVTTFSRSGREVTPTETGNILQAASISPEGDATIWYDTGVRNGKYSNAYVSLMGRTSQVGTVNGIVSASGYCGSRNLSIVRQSFVGTTGDPTQNQLVALSQSVEPSVIAGWNYDPEFRPVASTIPCSPDGKYMYALYASAETVSSNTGSPGLTLVRIDTVNGGRTETQLQMPGHTWNTHRSSLVLVEDRLFWTTRDGEILSAGLDGSSDVKKHWKLPLPDKAAVYARGSVLAVVTGGDDPSFAEYDYVSGDAVREPIELPWLSKIEGATSESGGSVYGIDDVVAIGS